jgi:hypothetical protein
MKDDIKSDLHSNVLIQQKSTNSIKSKMDSWAFVQMTTKAKKSNAQSHKFLLSQNAKEVTQTISLSLPSLLRRFAPGRRRRETMTLEYFVTLLLAGNYHKNGLIALLCPQ